jgi:16S rRNA (cytosine967-C5)-methyltransferase
MNTGESTSENKGNRFHRYLNYVSAIIRAYNGKEPFHLYLKKYFSQNKKHGSGDRKKITSLCYGYFRLGFGVTNGIPLTEKILLGFFLIEKEKSLFLEQLKPEWNTHILLNISEKIEMTKNIFDPNKIFPFPDELSNEINFQKFCLSYLIQPKLFIRVRPGFKNAVLEKLQSANITYNQINAICFSFSNTEKVSDILDIDNEAVIQDYNSQNTLNSLSLHLPVRQAGIVHQATPISVWDCCAGSGGKSILVYDLLKNINLTVSDTRKNILQNLKKRFTKAGIKNYQSFVADLTVLPPLRGVRGRPFFDLIIADVPCSGSGTWSRTPEQLSFFSKEKIMMYSDLQKKIVTNAVNFLNENGHLLYITCSVFKKENEEIVDFICKKKNFELVESSYLNGYGIQADTLFTALLKKN